MNFLSAKSIKLLMCNSIFLDFNNRLNLKTYSLTRTLSCIQIKAGAQFEAELDQTMAEYEKKMSGK